MGLRAAAGPGGGLRPPVPLAAPPGPLMGRERTLAPPQAHAVTLHGHQHHSLQSPPSPMAHPTQAGLAQDGSFLSWSCCGQRPGALPQPLAPLGKGAVWEPAPSPSAAPEAGVAECSGSWPGPQDSAAPSGAWERAEVTAAITESGLGGHKAPPTSHLLQEEGTRRPLPGTFWGLRGTGPGWGEVSPSWCAAVFQNKDCGAATRPTQAADHASAPHPEKGRPQGPSELA